MTILPPHSEMRLELEHDGRQVTLDRWQSYELRLDCRGVSTFRVTLPPTAKNLGHWKHGGATFRATYQGSLQFVGIVDERSDATKNDATDLQMAGRNSMGLMSDVAIEPSALRISGKPLDAIAAQWIAPHAKHIPYVTTDLAATRYIAAGAGKGGRGPQKTDTGSIRFDAEGRSYRVFGATATPPTSGTKGRFKKFGKASPEYRGVGTEQIKTSSVRLGMTILEGIEDLCAQIGVAPTSASDGSLCLFRPLYEFDSTAYGDGLVILWDHDSGRALPGGNVSAIEVSTTISSRRSIWYASATGKPSKKARGKELIMVGNSIKDVSPAFWKRTTTTTLGASILHKPGVLPLERISNRKHFIRAARRHVAESMLGGLSIECLVPGHHAPSGALWVPDTTVRVHDERNDIFDVMYIHSVERRYDMNGGRDTKLSLMPCGLWLGDGDDPSVPDSQWYADMMGKVWW